MSGRLYDVGGRWGKNRIHDSGFRRQEAEEPGTGSRGQGKGPILNREL